MISKFYLIIAALLTGAAIVYRLNIDFSLLKQTEDTNTLPDSVKLFTKESLSRFDGLQRNQLYLSILGTVYDVSKAQQHYGPGQSYHIFTGRDASRSFITGEFATDAVSDEVTDLSPTDLLSLKQWQQFYAKAYDFKGRLVGKYYDAGGQPTQYSEIVEELMKTAENRKNDRNSDEQQYPPCNVEWDAEKGTRVWCTNRSGGIVRDWTGLPRKYYKAGSQAHRCACIEDVPANNPNVQPYDNCDARSVSCYVAS